MRSVATGHTSDGNGAAPARSVRRHPVTSIGRLVVHANVVGIPGESTPATCAGSLGGQRPQIFRHVADKVKRILNPAHLRAVACVDHQARHCFAARTMPSFERARCSHPCAARGLHRSIAYRDRLASSQLVACVASRHDQGRRTLETRLTEDQKVRSARELVNRFRKKVSVDFQAARAFEIAALDERRNRRNVRRRRPVVVERRHLRAHAIAHAHQRRRRGERVQ